MYASRQLPDHFTWLEGKNYRLRTAALTFEKDESFGSNLRVFQDFAVSRGNEHYIKMKEMSTCL